MSTHCPVCNKPARAEYAPFCSQRCKDVDLGRWLKGVYVVPGMDSEEAGSLPPEEPGGGQKRRP